MKKKKQLLMAMLCAFAMLSNSVSVLAQSKDKQQEPKSNTKQAPEAPSDFFWVGAPFEGPVFNIATPGPGQEIAAVTPARQVEFIHNEFSFDSKLVKDAPYSADVVNETIQTLGDGNRIIRNSSSKIYRDSAGRTRREQSLNVVGPWAVSGDAPKIIFINDPVSGVNYNLNPLSKTANKMALPRMGAGGGGRVSSYSFSSSSSRTTVKGEGGGGQAKFTTDDGNVIVLSGEGAEKALAELKASKTATVESSSSDGQKTIRVLRPGGGPGVVSGVASSGGDVMTYFGKAEANRESLGTQTIEGVQAEGTRVTFTIPAGKIGNERPIVTVNEQWYSPELQAVVMSKNSDPRTGETTYRLTNIVRSEPDPGLFQVPSDYTVNEGGFGFGSGRPVEIMRGLDIERKAKKQNEN